MAKILAAVVIVAYLIGVGWWVVFQWSECRSMDFSLLYCVQHVF